MATKYVCYTLDLEEDHAGLLKDRYLGLNYLEHFIEVVQEHNIPVSFFVQGKLIENFPEQIELLRMNGFDVHCHSYSHPINKNHDPEIDRYEIEKSWEVYRNFFGENPIGYRYPLGALNRQSYALLRETGFKFDSSVFPTWRPGHFNNLSKPLHPYYVDGIVEIPFSVLSPVLRIPVALSYMKLFYPLHFIKRYNTTPIIFDFHMHDLYQIDSTKELDLLSRLPYLRHKKRGLEIFLSFHAKLMKEGYKAVPIRRIYEEIRV